MAKSWMELLDRSLPESRFFVRCEGVDLREHTRDFDFAPMVEVHRGNSERSDLDFDRNRYFINGSQFGNFRAGANCYTFFLVTISSDEILFEENYDDAEGPEHARTMALLRFLLQQPERPWRWSGHSHYTDSGESSEHREGSLVAAFG